MSSVQRCGVFILLTRLSMIALVVKRRLKRSKEGLGGKAVNKGLVAAAAGGVKALISDDEDEGWG